MAKGFIVACKDYFGLLPGETTTQFLQEVKKLDDNDRREVYDYFKSIGIECDEPKSATA